MPIISNLRGLNHALNSHTTRLTAYGGAWGATIGASIGVGASWWLQDSQKPTEKTYISTLSSNGKSILQEQNSDSLHTMPGVVIPLMIGGTILGALISRSIAKSSCDKKQGR